MKKVYKYGTGKPIPEGAEYLCTQVEDQVFVDKNSDTDDEVRTRSNRLVWHYFLVDADEKSMCCPECQEVKCDPDCPNRENR